MNFFAVLRELDTGQRKIVLASFLGWTLDAFDYFLLVFVIPEIARDFRDDEYEQEIIERIERPAEEARDDRGFMTFLSVMNRRRQRLPCWSNGDLSRQGG
jgi:hypothetical protein